MCEDGVEGGVCKDGVEGAIVPRAFTDIFVAIKPCMQSLVVKTISERFGYLTPS